METHIYKPKEDSELVDLGGIVYLFPSVNKVILDIIEL